jgi:hypothetical protein
MKDKNIQEQFIIDQLAINNAKLDESFKLNLEKNLSKQFDNRIRIMYF